MAAATDFEQFMLELINSARMDPQGDFDRYLESYDPLSSDNADIDSALQFFGVDGDLLLEQVEALTSVAPLAWNSELNEAATTHSDLMIEQDTQSHNLEGEASLGDRITAAGYTWSTVGENIFAFTESPIHGHAGFMVDWGFTDTGIQTPPGHRNSILSAAFQEVGIGVIEESDASTSVGPFVVTQNFGTRLFDAPDAILLGVFFDDLNGDSFYSLGEGVGDITTTIKGEGSDTSPDSGGYNIDTTAGTKTVTFSGDSLKQNVTVKATVDSENAKIDLQDGTLLKSSVSLVLKSGAKHAELYTDNDLDLTGNKKANMLTGNDGKNTLKGNGGKDQLFGEGGKDTLNGGGGKDILDGGKGNDKLTGKGGADTFVFGKKYGKDKITDFQNDIDTVQLDDALWKGTLSTQEIVDQFGAVKNGNIVLDFGKHELKLLDTTDLDALVNDLQIV
ncbi:MAG: CAP domain-containing protein [Pseudoruegeria sp.]